MEKGLSDAGREAEPCAMSELVERLPWRLGALGGLTVGAASLLGGIDLWQVLLRVGGAFVTFYGLGFLLRAVLRQGAASPPPRAKRKTGAHVDAKTPDMTPSDLHPPDPAPPGSGREG